MSEFTKFLKSSFRGVEFFTKSVENTEGIKHTIHTYPDSNNVYVEQAGLNAEKINLNFVIGSPNYFQKKDALKNALRQMGSGLLIHPTEGQISVKVDTWNFTEEINGNVGKATGMIAFIKETGEPYPIVLDDSISNTKNLQEQSTFSTKGFFDSVFDVSKTDYQGYVSNLDNLTNSLDVIDGAVNDIKLATDIANEFNNQIQKMNANAGSLIQSANNLSNSYIAVFNSIELISDVPKDIFLVLKGLFGFGNYDVNESLNTARIEQSVNNIALNNYIQVESLNRAFIIATTIDYETYDELFEFKDILNEQFNKVKAYDFDSDSLKDLVDLRDATFDYLDTLNPDKIINIEYGYNISSLLSSFEFYGNTDLANRIDELNGELNPAFMNGSVKVFQEQ